MLTEKEEYVLGVIEGHSKLYEGSPVYVRSLLAYLQTATHTKEGTYTGKTPFVKSEPLYELHPILASLEDAGKVELTADGVRLLSSGK